MRPAALLLPLLLGGAGAFAPLERRRFWFAATRPTAVLDLSARPAEGSAKKGKDGSPEELPTTPETQFFSAESYEQLAELKRKLGGGAESEPELSAERRVEMRKLGGGAESETELSAERRVEMLHRSLLQRSLRNGNGSRNGNGAVKVSSSSSDAADVAGVTKSSAAEVRARVDTSLADGQIKPDVVVKREAAAAAAAAAASPDADAAMRNLKKRYELQIDRLNIAILRLTDRIESSRGESERKLADAHDRASAERRRLESKIAKLVDRNVALREETEGLESRLAGARAGARSLWANLVEARRNMTAEVERVRDEAERVMNATKAEAEELVARSEGLRAELERAEGRATKAEGRVEELRAQLEGPEVSNKEEQERDMKELEGRLRSQFDKRAKQLAARGRLFADRLKATRVESDHEAKVLRAKAFAASRQLKDQISALRKELEETKSELVSAQESEQKAQMQARMQEEAEAVAGVSSREETERVQTLSGQVRQLTNRLHTLKVESDRKVTLARARGFTAARQLEDRVTALMEELEEAKAKLVRKEEEDEEKKKEEKEAELKVDDKIGSKASSPLPPAAASMEEERSEEVKELTAKVRRTAAKLKILQAESDRKVRLLRARAHAERAKLEERLESSREELGEARVELARTVEAAWNLLEDQAELAGAGIPYVAVRRGEGTRALDAPVSEAAAAARDGEGKERETLTERVRSLTDELHAIKVESKCALMDVQAQARAERKKLEDRVASLKAEAEEARMDLAREMDVTRQLRLDLDEVRSTMTRHLVAVRTESSRELGEVEAKLRIELEQVKAAAAEERRQYQSRLSLLESQLADARAEVEGLRAELAEARRGGGAATKLPTEGAVPTVPLMAVTAPPTARMVTSAHPAEKSAEEAAEEAQIAAQRLTEFLTGGRRAIEAAEKAEDEARITAEQRLTDFLGGGTEAKGKNEAPFAPKTATTPVARVVYRYEVEYENGARDVDLPPDALRPVDPRVAELAVGTHVEVMSFHVGALTMPSVSMSRRGGVGGKGNRRQRGFIMNVKTVNKKAR